MVGENQWTRQLDFVHEMSVKFVFGRTPAMTFVSQNPGFETTELNEESQKNRW